MGKPSLKLKVKNLAKLGILMGIKEGYLFIRNLFGFYEHPFLTTKKIVDKRDWSQGMLIFGLPVYLWFGWIFILLVSRLFLPPIGGQAFQRLQFGFWAKVSFLASSFFVFFVFLFFAYWILEVVKRGRRGK